MCAKQTRKVISKRMENECVCVRVVRRPPMLMCSHQIFFLSLPFFLSIRYSPSSRRHWQQRRRLRDVSFTLSYNTQFYTSTLFYFFFSLTTYAHTHTATANTTHVPVHNNTTYRITRQTAWKPNFLFCAESFFLLTATAATVSCSGLRVFIEVYLCEVWLAY